MKIGDVIEIIKSGCYRGMAYERGQRWTIYDLSCCVHMVYAEREGLRIPFYIEGYRNGPEAILVDIEQEYNIF